MRFRMILVLAATLCASCSSREIRESLQDWPRIDWDWQTHVLESREAWDNATGRDSEYQGGGAQLAR